jgi:hypothetical protein
MSHDSSETHDKHITLPLCVLKQLFVPMGDAIMRKYEQDLEYEFDKNWMTEELNAGIRA